MNDDRYDALAWGSHLPALLGCIGATTGPVLELGVGHFSTPALHALCGAMDRELYSLEADPFWMELFAGKYNHPKHRFLRGDYDNSVPKAYGQLANGMRWATAFVDNSPGGERRKKDFAYLIERSIFVVVHDYENENREAIQPLVGDCFRHVCTTYSPPTLVASFVKQIPESVLVL